MSAKKRVCIVFTGGTIGMVWEGNTLKPQDTSEFFAQFQNTVPEIYELAEIHWIKLFAHDSTNLNPGHWTEMAQGIYDLMQDRERAYDAFVVVHGTDTMHFSASALAFAFGKELNVPIVFVGAQTDMSVPHGDARPNLIRAVRVALEPLAEVVICFGNHVFRGCRTQKKDEKRFDAFESPAFFPIADITERILLHPMAKKREEQPRPLRFEPNFDASLLQISLIPGLKPNVLLPLITRKNFDGIVLQSFGAGNVPMLGEYSFETLIRTATQNLIPVIITSQFPANSTLETFYEPGKKANEIGGIPTGNMTNACAIAKFYWVLSQIERKIRSGRLQENERIVEATNLMHRLFVQEFDKSAQ